MSNILTAFNDHFVEFVNDVHAVFPEDVDILTAKNSLIAIRKANPKMIVKIWRAFIADKYASEYCPGILIFLSIRIIRMTYQSRKIRIKLWSRSIA